MGTYWVVYSAFHVAEYFTDFLLSWFPLYFLFKVMFLCWCMAPYSWNGSVFIYTKFISPFVMQHQNLAEEIITDAVKIAKDLGGKAQAEAKKVAMEQILADKEEKKE